MNDDDLSHRRAGEYARSSDTDEDAAETEQVRLLVLSEIASSKLELFLYFRWNVHFDFVFNSCSYLE